MKHNKLVVKLPVLKAKVTLLFGVLGADVAVPKGVNHEIFEGSYAGRCCFRVESDSIYPFHALIHVKDAGRAGVVIHEIYHAVQMIQGAMGVAADFDNDELGAYMMQYIAEEVFMHINSKLQCPLSDTTNEG